MVRPEANCVNQFLDDVLKINLIPVLKVLMGISLLLYSSLNHASFLSSGSQFTNLDSDNGLSVGSVEAIYQDSTGYMWFGGPEGLVRYDGYDFEKFTHNSEDPYSISDTHVWSIIEDSRNILWIATRNGLNRFEQKKNTFTGFKPKGRKSFTIRDILQDDIGLLWLAVDEGLVSFDLKTEEFTFLKVPVAEATDIGYILDLMLDREGNIWIATLGAGLIRFDPKTRKSQQYYVQKDNPATLLANRIWKVIQTKDGIIWAATDIGLNSIDLVSGKVEYILHDPDYDKRGIAKGLSGAVATDILEDVDQNLWIGTNAGITVYSRAKKQFTIMKQSEYDKQSLSTDVIRSLFQDINGDIWIGGFPQGVSFFNRRDMVFETFRHDSRNKKTLNHKSVLSILEDSKKRLWFATDGGGINFYDPSKAFPVIYHSHTSPDDSNYIPGSAVLDLMEDHDGNIWAGMWANGISKINLATGKIKHHLAYIGNQSGLQGENVWSAFEDSQKRIWLSTITKGIFRYNRNTDKFIHYTPDKNNINSISSADAWMIHEDSKGQIWIATDKGLDRFDEKEERFIHFQHSVEDKQTLGAEAVLTIHEDKGLFWVGTRGGGLNRFDPETGKVKRYGKKQGFGELNVVSIEQDDDENLWLGTYSGLYQFNPKTEIFRSFDVSNGLQGNRFNINASIKLSSGELIFGGTNGYSRFNPTKVLRNTFSTPVVLRDLKLLNKSVQIGNVNSPLKVVIDETKNITFDHTHRVITFVYAGLSYRNPEKNKYAYKLQGFDHDWNLVGQQRTATYTSLNAGNYQFQVKAANNDGVWGETKILKVKVLPPPWLSWWAYMIYISVMMSLIGMAIQNQRNKQKLVERQNQFLELKVQEKTRDIKSILEAIQQGVLTIENEEGKVGEEFSVFLKQLVGKKQITGQNFYELLFEQSTFSVDEKSQIMSVVSASVGVDEFGFKVNSHLLPTEAYVSKNNIEYIYELDWNPIVKNKIVVKILLVIRDVTELRALEVQSKKQRREIEIIQEIINIPIDKFESVINSFYLFIDESKRIISGNETFKFDSLQHIFRNMHTMKGMARSYNLKSLSETTHLLEQFFSECVSRKEWSKSVFLDELDKASKVVDSYKNISQNELGRNLKNENNVSIDKQIIEANIEILSGLNISEMSEKEKDDILKMKQILEGIVINSLETILHDQISATASIARQLDKAQPIVHIDDPGFSLNSEVHNLVNNVFTHLFRNAIDHGIEAPEERLREGKSEQGNIYIDLSGDESSLRIAVRDDGRGLNLKKIHASAIKSGLVKRDVELSHQEIVDLIFSSGLSTAKEVTEISGRGIGMDAVRTFLIEKNCSVEIDVVKQTSKNDNKSDYVPIEIVIRMPESLFKYRGKSQRGDVVSIRNN